MRKRAGNRNTRCALVVPFHGTKHQRPPCGGTYQSPAYPPWESLSSIQTKVWFCQVFGETSLSPVICQNRLLTHRAGAFHSPMHPRPTVRRLDAVSLSKLNHDQCVDIGFDQGDLLGCGVFWYVPPGVRGITRQGRVINTREEEARK